MNKQEFCDRVKGISYEDINEKEWDVISTVYTFHPTISDTDGKQQIAKLYNMGGMGILNDMYPTAKKLAELESIAQEGHVAYEKMEKEHKDEIHLMELRHARQKQVLRDKIAMANAETANLTETFTVKFRRNENGNQKERDSST